MKKKKSAFVCNNCGYETSKWQGQCPQCKEWNTFEEILVVAKKNNRNSATRNTISKPVQLSQIIIKENFKIKTNISELDRALSGGLVKGQVVLLAGHPGIGKSTLLLQMASNFSELKVLYVSAEESIDQVAIRSKRLGGSESVEVISTFDIDEVLEISKSYDIVIIDSVQMMNTYDIQNRAGSVPQIIECTNRIVEVAKNSGVAFVVVGHITKEGNIAGPKMLEHMVDTVLYLEGDKQSELRLLRVHKNRFGSDSEVGIFTMTEEGLKSVTDISKLFESYTDTQYGVANAMILEGSRPVVVEVQALTTKSSYGYPKRTATGISLNRLQMLIAVLQKYVNLDLSEFDVFVNITSGISIKEPSSDLAVVTAIMSSYYEKPVSNKAVFFGEVGLTSEVRKVVGEQRRMKEAKNLGYDKIFGAHNIKKISQIKKILL